MHHTNVAIGDPVFMLIYFNWKSTIFMLLTLWLAWRTASGVVWG